MENLITADGIMRVQFSISEYKTFVGEWIIHVRETYKDTKDPFCRNLLT